MTGRWLVPKPRSQWANYMQDRNCYTNIVKQSVYSSATMYTVSSKLGADKSGSVGERHVISTKREYSLVPVSKIFPPSSRLDTMIKPCSAAATYSFESRNKRKV